MVEHYFAWLENSTTDDSIYLFIRMELCDKTLQQIMHEINSDSNFKVNGTLTLMGYYISSQIFIEILKCVQYLHKKSNNSQRPQSL